MDHAKGTKKRSRPRVEKNKYSRVFPGNRRNFDQAACFDLLDGYLVIFQMHGLVLLTPAQVTKLLRFLGMRTRRELTLKA